jgi:hypothetical protein
LEKDEIIVEKKDSPLVNIYVVIDGCLSYKDQNFVKGDVFGIEFVFPEYKTSNLLLQNLVTKECTFGYIEVEKWFKVLGSNNLNLEDIFKKNQFESISKRRFKLRKKSTICRNLTL